MESKNNWKAWLYLAPAIILLLIFTFYPLINTILIAFAKDYNIYANETALGAIFRSGFTFDNFGYVLGLKGISLNGQVLYDKTVIEYALPNTLIIVFVTVPLSILIALLIAVGINSIKWFQKIFQTIFFIPYVTNSIAIGMVFAVIFAGTNGLWNSIFHLGNVSWVDMGASRLNGMFALCVYIIWHALPYKILIFLSGLQGIDKQYYQAAQIDSASRSKTFFRVTVPLLSPQIVYVMITSLIGSFKEYSSIVALFNGQGTSAGSYNMYTITYYIYDNISKAPTRASAAAVLLFIIIMFFTVIQQQVSAKRVHY